MSTGKRLVRIRIGELAVSHWWSCCPVSEPPYACSCNLSSDGRGPCCFAVTIARIANGDNCTSCTNLNKTYYLSQTEENSCIWECPYVCPNLAGASCASRGATWTATLTVSDEGGGQYKITVEIGPHTWSKTYNEKPSLSDISDSLTWVSDAGSCDSSSSTCAIAATSNPASQRYCPCTCVECGHCISDDAGSQTMEVVISGVVNDECTDCANANGTWILTYYYCGTSFCVNGEPAPNLGAVWKYSHGPTHLCYGDGYSGISVWLGLHYDPVAGKRTIVVHVGPSSSTQSTACRGLALWRTETGTKWDCWNVSETLSGAEDSVGNYAYGCDATGATIQITSIT